MNLGAYVRLSRDETEDSYSPARQERDIRDWAERHGHTVVRFYSDILSGLLAARPAYQEMLRDAKLGRIEGVVVKWFNRLGRDNPEYFATLRDLGRLNVQVVSVVEGDDPFVRDLMGVLGHREVRENSKRTTDVLCEMAAQGRYLSGARVGFDLTPIPNQPPKRAKPIRLPVPNADMDPVREMFERCAAGWGVKRIGRWLESIGFRYSGPRTVWEILRCPLYKGVYRYNRRCYSRLPERVHAEKPPEEWVEVQLIEPPVPPELWEAAQRALDERRHARARTHADNPALLVDIAYCGRCGSRVAGIWTKSRRGSAYTISYTCQRRQNGYACDLPAQRSHFLDEPVRAELLRLAGLVSEQTAELLRREIRRRATFAGLRDRRPAIEQAIARQRQRAKRLREALLSGRIVGEEFDEEKAAIDARLGELQVELEAIGGASPDYPLEGALEALGEFAAVSQGADIVRERRLLAALAGRVLVHGKGLYAIQWRSPELAALARPHG